MIRKDIGNGFFGWFMVILTLAVCFATFIAPEVFVVFLVLKLANVVAFGWLIVFLPLIIMFGLIGLDVGILVMVSAEPD